MEDRPILPNPPQAVRVSPLLRLLARAASSDGGWLPFDRFMALALYAPGLGYYASSRPKFGQLPPGLGREGSDFVTAPELSPLFGAALAVQVADAMRAASVDEVWEFGAGTGALADQLIMALTGGGVSAESAAATALPGLRRYTIVELSANLREQQRKTLASVIEAGHVDVRWVDELPASFKGVVIGNEVLDAMPVKLLARHDGAWLERGVRVSDGNASANERANASDGSIELTWEDRDTTLRPAVDPAGPHDYLTEVHPQAEAFIRTLADRLTQGVAIFVDYGFPEDEFYHPQRSQGTLMCHQHHKADSNPLVDVGSKDITAHVNFTGVALAAQEAGLNVSGYTSQARFLINCGLVDQMALSDLPTRVMAQRLIYEHEMGELFKVLLLTRGVKANWVPIGFAQGDRTHRL